MDVFFVGIITLLVATAIVYIVFFGFIFYWHLTNRTYVIVPMIFTFEFFIKGFVAVAIVSVLFQYLPYLTNLLGL